MATDKTPTPEDEYFNAEEALTEFEKVGKTDRHCLRCGGKLNFYTHESGYSIWCEKPGCYKVTVRGI